MYIHIHIFFEAVIVIMCNYFPKLLKTHSFILQIFRSHFGSFFCASAGIYMCVFCVSIYMCVCVCVSVCLCVCLHLCTYMLSLCMCWCTLLFV